MLCFETLYRANEAGWSELQTKTASVTFGLGKHTEPAPGNAVPVFDVAEIDTARRDLEKAMVKFDSDTIVVEGMVKTATFYYPDGNALMLAQDLTKGA